VSIPLRDAAGRRLEMSHDAIAAALAAKAAVVSTVDDAVTIFRYRDGLIVANKRDNRSVTRYDRSASSDAISDFLVRVAVIDAAQADAHEVNDAFAEQPQPENEASS
jgi:hypothetical protein